MSDKKNKAETPSPAVDPICGIVMPISAIDNCPESHNTHRKKS